MNRFVSLAVIALLAVFPVLGCKSTPEPQPTVAPVEKKAAEPTKKFASVLEKMKSDAVSLEKAFKGPRAALFLEAVKTMDEVGHREIYSVPGALNNVSLNGEKQFYTPDEFAALTPEEQAKLEKHNLNVEFYYSTKYGDMLSYTLVLNALDRAKVGNVRQDNKLVDFGFGYIGHLRGLAMMGLNVVGIDVDPLLKTLYSRPDDTGTIAGPAGIEGQLRLAIGFYPKDPQVKKKVGMNMDVFMTKNTLKAEYLKPIDGSDPSISLGVDDQTFLKAIHEALVPNGIFIAYNTCDAPITNCAFPFDRDMVEKTGFRVASWNEDDTEAALRLWYILGRDKEGVDISKLKASFTLLQRK